MTSVPTIPNPDDLRFDVYAVSSDRIIQRIFQHISLATAEILSGMERDEFDRSVMHFGWVAAWLEQHPIAIMPEGELVRKPQFEYLMELVG